jgi:APA family basic amino acid/polyamine antiporter
MQEVVKSAEEGKLVRAIGVPGLAANIVNTTIGAGIFVIPALVASMLGAASPLAFAICALAMTFFVTSFAIAGSRVSLTGGLYAYVETAFGPFIGFLAGVLFFLTAVLSVSGVVSLFAGSIGTLAPALDSVLGRFLITALVFAALTWINVRGVRGGTRAVEVVTIVKLVPLLFFIGVGIFFVKGSNAFAIARPNPQSLGQGVLLLIFAFAGIEVALVPSGEVLNPARTVPRAIYLALGVTTLLYVLIQLVAQGILGADLGKFHDAPLAEAAFRFSGSAGRSFLILGATISALGFVTSDVLSSPRILFALARDRFLPKFFAHVHPRFRTPDVAIVAYCVICLVLSLSSSFQQLAILANVAVLLLYLCCCAAALELMRRDVRSDGTPFTFPGAWVVPPIAIVIILWILAHATRKEFLITGIVLVIASVLFLFRGRGPARVEKG